jgi:hypothetical protein
VSTRLLDGTERLLCCGSDIACFASQPGQRHFETRATNRRLRQTDSSPPSNQKVCLSYPISTCNAFCADTAFSYSSNLAAANAHLSQLLPLTQISDPDLSHQISLLEIALLMHPSRPDLPSAYRKIACLLATTSDLAQTLHLLTLKAAVFAAAGKPEKGFSIAVRAASRAERAGLVPVLLEALAALTEILNKVGEFGAARELAEAALPQVCLLYLGLVAKVFGSCGPVWKYPLITPSI